MSDLPIGDPRPAGAEGPAGDQRPSGDSGPAGDPRPAGAETVNQPDTSTDAKPEPSDDKPKAKRRS